MKGLGFQGNNDKSSTSSLPLTPPLQISFTIHNIVGNPFQPPNYSFSPNCKPTKNKPTHKKIKEKIARKLQMSTMYAPNSKQNVACNLNGKTT
jgi:hypothetical protein